MNSIINLGKKRVGLGEPVFVIAEIGANFSNFDEARQMIDAASKAGCDAVKLQTFRAATLVRQGAEFVLENGTRMSQYDFFQARELSRELHVKLKEHVESAGLVFFSTPSHKTDVELLEAVGVGLYKIGSDDLTNLPFIDIVARTGKPTILSTGMCTLGEVEEAVQRFQGTGNQNLVLLHCVVGYPAPRREASLRVIGTLRQAFGIPVGFSDHTPGLVASIVAVSLGACVIEKHFTLDRSAGGPDNETSLEPDEMAELVSSLRDVDAALGSPVKSIQPVERKWREAARKSLVASRPIKVGECLSADMVGIKRPGDGLPPRHYWEILGRKVRADIATDECLRWELFDDTRGK